MVAPGGLPSGPPRELPRRLTLASLTLAAAFGVSLILIHTLGAAGWLDTPRPELHTLIGGAIMLVSVAMAWVAHLDRLPPARLLHVGLAYEVLVAASISLRDNLGAVAVARPLHDISWLAVLIVLFPLVVPAPPARSVVASLLAASTWPVAFWVGIRWLGNPAPPASVAVLNFLENYIAAALALVPTMIIRRLAADV